MATIPINDTAPRIAYTATAGQTVFPYPFWVSAEEDIIVYQNGIILTLTTDYTISGVLEPTGGNITLLTGATLNDSIVIVRDIPIKRTSEFQTGGSFQASVLNASLSKQVAMMQQVENNQSRSLQLSPSDTFTGNMNLPTIISGKYLKVKDDASGWEMANQPVVTNSSLIIDTPDAHKMIAVNAAGNDFDMLASVGTAGQVLTSNGSGSAPSWQTSPTVDVADLSAGTDGELITWDTAGNPTTIAAGTSGYVLTANGAGAVPTWEQLAPSGKVLGAAFSSSTSSGAPSTSYVTLRTLNYTPQSSNSTIYIEAGGFWYLNTTTMGGQITVDSVSIYDTNIGQMATAANNGFPATIMTSYANNSTATKTFDFDIKKIAGGTATSFGESYLRIIEVQN